LFCLFYPHQYFPPSIFSFFCCRCWKGGLRFLVATSSCSLTAFVLINSNHWRPSCFYSIVSVQSFFFLFFSIFFFHVVQFAINARSKTCGWKGYDVTLWIVNKIWRRGDKPKVETWLMFPW
jgi:hypothetical protein